MWFRIHQYFVLVDWLCEAHMAGVGVFPVSKATWVKQLMDLYPNFLKGKDSVPENWFLSTIIAYLITNRDVFVKFVQHAETEIMAKRAAEIFPVKHDSRLITEFSKLVAGETSKKRKLEEGVAVCDNNKQVAAEISSKVETTLGTTLVKHHGEMLDAMSRRWDDIEKKMASFASAGSGASGSSVAQAAAASVRQTELEKLNNELTEQLDDAKAQVVALSTECSRHQSELDTLQRLVDDTLKPEMKRLQDFESNLLMLQEPLSDTTTRKGHHNNLLHLSDVVSVLELDEDWEVFDPDKNQPLTEFAEGWLGRVLEDPYKEIETMLSIIGKYRAHVLCEKLVRIKSDVNLPMLQADIYNQYVSEVAMINCDSLDSVDVISDCWHLCKKAVVTHLQRMRRSVDRPPTT